CPARQP
ncbi:hypothetical protein BN1723_020941, partial [Verticillium longisporum]